MTSQAKTDELHGPCPICGEVLNRLDAFAVKDHFEGHTARAAPKSQKVPSGKRYLKMLGGEPKVRHPKRALVGKPNQMSQRKHRIIGHSGKSPRARHAAKREAESQHKARPKSKTYASVQEALERNKPL